MCAFNFAHFLFSQRLSIFRDSLDLDVIFYGDLSSSCPLLSCSNLPRLNLLLWNFIPHVSFSQSRLLSAHDFCAAALFQMQPPPPVRARARPRQCVRRCTRARAAQRATVCLLRSPGSALSAAATHAVISGFLQQLLVSVSV